MGCLLAGAVGDALGAPVEFLSLAEITRRSGPRGVLDLLPAYGRVGAITDDTQMTLFTAEGMIRAVNRWHDRGLVSAPAVLHRAYLRWLITQGEAPGRTSPVELPLNPGWLSAVASMNARRAPGNTCRSALRQARPGSREQPINDSKGCGGVMRVAPIGLAQADAVKAYELGCEAAAITHGHPAGYLAAGAFAFLISRLAARASLEGALLSLAPILRAEPGGDEVHLAIARAVQAARSAPGRAEILESLGAGWVAEEALAIAVYCALSTSDLEAALLLAVNHGGDSDSTGSLTGNILGVMQGEAAIPPRWLASLELRQEITILAHDLWQHFHDPDFQRTEVDFQRYPPN